MESEKVEKIAIAKLKPHPKNPRIGVRSDVIESIRGQIQKAGGFPVMHALIVRPVGGEYQIVSGHNRRAAAEAAGLTQVPCWVKEMSEDEAFMQLVLANAQGELSPLEIGMHALDAVPTAQGKKGAGLEEYAGAIGKSRQYISQVRQSAEVLRKLTCEVESAAAVIKDSTDPDAVSAAQAKLEQWSWFTPAELRDRAQHLAAIHAAPEDLWPVLAKRLLLEGWSVSDTKEAVKKSKEFSDLGCWTSWLTVAEAVDLNLATSEFSPLTCRKLIDEAGRMLSVIDVTDLSKEARELAKQWCAAWLDAERPRTVREIEAYARTTLNLIEEYIKQVQSRWNHGNWREFADAIEDSSVSLVLTDPPYGMDFQSDYRLDRSKPRKHEKIENDGDEQAAREITECFSALLPKLKENAAVLCFCHWSNEPEIREAVEAAGLTIRNSLIWDKKATGMGDPQTTFAPRHERILFAVKGSPKLLTRLPDILECVRESSERHPTEKPVELLKQLIGCLTVEGDLVADPFGGVASTLVAARDTNRNYWGCEINEKYHEIGEGRLQ